MRQSQEVVCRFLFHHVKALLEEACEKGTKGRHTLFERHLRLVPKSHHQIERPHRLRGDLECKQLFHLRILGTYSLFIFVVEINSTSKLPIGSIKLRWFPQ